MTIHVQGIPVELTSDQVKSIETEKKRRLREYNSFAKILKFHGFEKKDGGYAHKTENWWAQIEDYGNWKEVWMVGPGLKAWKSYPGGYNYGSPKEIDKEISRYLDSKNER